MRQERPANGSAPCPSTSALNQDIFHASGKKRHIRQYPVRIRQTSATLAGRIPRRRPLTGAESAEASAELAARVAAWENEGGAAG
jgi:hypothetical protein